MSSSAPSLCHPLQGTPAKSHSAHFKCIACQIPSTATKHCDVFHNSLELLGFDFLTVSVCWVSLAATARRKCKADVATETLERNSRQQIVLGCAVHVCLAYTFHWTLSQPQKAMVSVHNSGLLCQTVSWDRQWSVRKGDAVCVRSVASDSPSEAEGHLHYHMRIQVIFQDLSVLQLWDN